MAKWGNLEACGSILGYSFIMKNVGNLGLELEGYFTLFFQVMVKVDNLEYSVT